MSVRILQGDCRDVLKTLPDAGVQCCISSPPYFGLRDYGTAQWDGGDPACDHSGVRRGHGDEKQSTSAGTSRDRVGRDCRKCGAIRVDQQIGLEATVDAYVSELVAVFREVRRVLRDDGTLWLNIGDSYTPGGRTWRATDKKSSARAMNVRPPTPEGLKPKDLIGVPWRLAFALQADGWYLRSEITWCKKAPMPESVRDRPTSATEKIFLLTKRPRYFYDAEAVKEENSSPEQLAHNLKYAKTYDAYDDRAGETGQPGNVNNVGIHSRPGTSGRNMRNYWLLGPEPFPAAHFAVFPTAIAERCIKAGTSLRGACPACGAPWVRVLERGGLAGEAVIQSTDRPAAAVRGVSATSALRTNGRTWRETREIGWQPSCPCDAGDLLPDDFEVIGTPTGKRAGDDPSLVTGRAGMNRPRGEAEGTRPITRYEQRRYAEQLRLSPHRTEMERIAGEAFAHYVRADRSGARPVPPELLEDWIERKWLDRVILPPRRPMEPVPQTILDPFAGAGTALLVADRLGRDAVGIELNPEYVAMIERRITNDAPLFASVEVG